LYPAVDVRAGRAVRLVHGEPGAQTDYGDPRGAALAWQRAGARWLHLVDLDAAFGTGDNSGLIAEIVATVDVPVELSGGVRNDRSLDAALATGCRRITIGTAALESPSWIAGVLADHADRICVGLDVRGMALRTRGWTADSETTLFEALARLDEAGCARYVVTDTARDGALWGPNLDLLHAVCRATERPVVGAGGVARLRDIRDLARLAGLGLEGAVIGKALYEGVFTLEQALDEALAAAADGDGNTDTDTGGGGFRPSSVKTMTVAGRESR
jgi:phosphoribosylanthranilate isomerase